MRQCSDFVSLFLWYLVGAPRSGSVVPLASRRRLAARTARVDDGLPVLGIVHEREGDAEGLGGERGAGEVRVSPAE